MVPPDASIVSTQSERWEVRVDIRLRSLIVVLSRTSSSSSLQQGIQSMQKPQSEAHTQLNHCKNDKFYYYYYFYDNYYD